jgi:hypothetical protein
MLTKNSIKFILRPYSPQFVFNIINDRRQTRSYYQWIKNGCPDPPPHKVKQQTISEYQKKFKYTTLIETGTYRGDMIEAQKKFFKKIISIELSYDFFEKAKKRFKKDKNVIIYHGDSGKVLPKVLLDLIEPAIFWLDGHYSGGVTAKGDKDCPIFEELNSIFNGKKFNHILLIDDARCFTGAGDYPTIKNLTEYIQSKNQNYKVEIKNDIIRYVIDLL